MFVSIDMDALVFLHKHVDHETVSALSWLECGQQVSIRVEPCHDNSRFLANVSELDVRMLYKNATGRPLPGDADHTALRYQLGDVVQLMPHARVLTAEVLAQVNAVEDRLYAGERFKYALGARVPAQAGELLPLKARSLTDKELAEAHMRSRNPIAGYPPKLSGQGKPWEAPAAPAPQVPAPPAPRAQTAAPDPVAASRGGKSAPGAVRAVVNAAADQAWEQAGRPADPAAVRSLAMGLHAGIAAQGHNPTTVRIKLSEWAKAKSA